MQIKKHSGNGNGTAHGNGKRNGSDSDISDVAVLLEAPIALQQEAIKPASRRRRKDQHVTEDKTEQLNGYIDGKLLLHVLSEVKNGIFGVRMPIDQVGINGKICDALNEVITLNEKMVSEFTKASNTIGKQGKLNQRIE